jgi:transposase InsO family protein
MPDKFEDNIVLPVGNMLSVSFTYDEAEDWFDRFESLLAARQLDDVVKNSSITGVKDAKVKFALHCNVEYREFKAIFKKAQHSSEIWAALRSRWARNTIANKFAVFEELFSFSKLAGETLDAFLTRGMNLYIELEAVKAMQEELFVYKVLQILNSDPKYTTWVQIVKTRNDLPKFIDLATEVRQQFADDLIKELTEPAHVEGAMHVNGTAPTCEYCGYRFHNKQDCRFFKSDSAQGNLKPPGWYKQHHKQRRNSKRQIRPQQKYESRHVYAGALVTTAGFNVSTSMQHGMILDSGATHHMVNDEVLLIGAQQADIKVKIADDSILSCTKTGSVEIQNHEGALVKLNNVLYMPDLSCNLLSVSKAQDAGYLVTFDSKGAKIERNGSTLLRARRNGGLYEIIGKPQPQMTPVYDALAGTGSALKSKTPRLGVLWHRRLGHLGYSSLQKMAKKGIVHGLPSADVFENPPVCWSCSSGKMTKKPFPSSPSRSTKPLELLHLDIAGPLRIQSAGGCRYFVTLLDDYSKHKAVKALKFKSEAPDFIKGTILHWERATGHKAVAIRHDRAKEFMSKDMSDWYHSHGIQMQPTSGYSPQENGAAERLNRTLWECALSMLADSGLSMMWWAEAVIHAAHLRNVTNSTGGLTPIELMTGKKPDVSTLRVFGSPCSVQVPIRHKQQFKDEPGVLLGFDLPNLEAYRVLTKRRQVVVRRTVTVNEFFEPHADRMMHEGMPYDDDDADDKNEAADPPQIQRPSQTPSPPTQETSAADTSVQETSPPTQETSAADNTLQPPSSPTNETPPASPLQGELLASPNRRSGRENKGCPPVRYAPEALQAFRLLGDATCPG